MNNLSNIVKILGMEYPEFNNLIELGIINTNEFELPIMYNDIKYITDGKISFHNNFGFKYMVVENFKYVAILDSNINDEPVLRLYVHKKCVDNALTLFEANLDNLLK